MEQWHASFYSILFCNLFLQNETEKNMLETRIDDKSGGTEAKDEG